MEPSVQTDDVFKLREALKQIHAAATRIRETTDVQSRLLQLISSFELFNRRVVKRVDKELLEDDWRLIRTLHLYFIETMIQDHGPENVTVAVPELKQVMTSANTLENNLHSDNWGLLETNCSSLLGEIRGAHRVCNQLNQDELTKIWYISSSLLGKASE